MSIYLKLALSILFLPNAYAQVSPPEVYTDKGACPFECCSYTKWTAVNTTKGYSSPSLKASEVTIIKVGTSVKAITGEVQTKRGKFVVKRDYKGYKEYKKGDVIWVYTYLGEAVFRVWFNGEMYIEGLEFSPYGGSSGTRCENDPSCFGELSAELEMVWWANVHLPNGKTVWVLADRNFSGQDACGG